MRLLERLPTSLPEGEGWRWVRLHPAGVCTGTAFAALAMTPSLLPRDWLFQGLVSGVSAAVGWQWAGSGKSVGRPRSAAWS